jgi:hypothetical protein
MPDPDHRAADPIPFTGADGHTYVILTRPDGTSERQRLADLVAATFLGPCPAGMELRHGPGGLSDNSLANLSYVPIEAPTEGG